MKFTRTKQIAAIMPVLFLTACASMQKPGLERGSLVQSDPVQIKQQDAQPDVVSADAYRLLVAEMAISRGQTEVAVENYLALAKSQNNPAIAERAVRVAVFGQNLEAAIEAALNPDTTEYIFFVADGTGGHAFATNLDDHNRNVARWREIEAERASDG